MKELITDHVREHLLALTKLGNRLLAAEKEIEAIETETRSLLDWPKKKSS